uniref:Uncharacterized protein n=3 Tax=unclassified Prevotella TaxID=2638335 RepID=A0AB33J6X0_9BACT
MKNLQKKGALVKWSDCEICTFKGQQLRMPCQLKEDPRMEVKQAMVDKMPALKDIMGEDLSGGVMYQVTHATAVIADLKGNTETYTF